MIAGWIIWVKVRFLKRRRTAVELKPNEIILEKRVELKRFTSWGKKVGTRAEMREGQEGTELCFDENKRRIWGSEREGPKTRLTLLFIHYYKLCKVGVNSFKELLIKGSIVS